MRMSLKELIIVLVLFIVAALGSFYLGVEKGRYQLVMEIRQGGWEIVSNTVTRVDYNLWPTSKLMDIKKEQR